MKLLLMADDHVGIEITRWLLAEYRDDLALVVTTSDNKLFSIVNDAKIASLIFESSNQVSAYINGMELKPDIGVLAWWPKLVKQPLTRVPIHGFINTHPGLLPHNRGKHYNFWALVEQVPFGVSLHMIDDGVDSGDIIAQTPIPYNWEDNGETLYVKARESMVRLFQETYPTIRKLDFPRRKQDLAQGSFHRAAELDEASRIDMDHNYCARNLLNLLRARTFTGHPSCWFSEEGEIFEVRINIKRKIL